MVPLHAGGGMRVKILDAWLWGLPTISTPIGAEGIELRDSENIVLAEGAPAFADTVMRVLVNAKLNRQLRAAGRTWKRRMLGEPCISEWTRSIRNSWLQCKQQNGRSLWI